MGGFRDIACPTLAIAASRGALAQCEMDPKDVEEIYMGCVIQSGMGQAPARQVALGCEMGIDTPSSTINKVCASGMKAAMLAA